MSKEYYIELILKKLSNNASSEECDSLEDWINESEKNSKCYEDLKKSWKEQELNNEYKVSQNEILESWKKVQNGIERTKTIRKDFVINKNTSKTKNWYFKAASFLLLGILSAYLFNVLYNEFNVKQISISTKNNEKKQVVLADGTKVWLNENSELKYPEKFNNEIRNISLIGEAYFEVKRNVNQPFIINAESIEIEVLGTSFNINNYIQNKNAVVSVSSGKVAVRDLKKNANEIILGKDQKGTFIKKDNQLNKSENDDINYLSWKTGKLHFVNNTLTETLNILTKYYKKQFKLKDENLGNSIKFNAVFDNQPLDETLEVISATLGVSFNKSDNVILVK